MSYKILDLYRDLPGANCSECGKPTCFAFAGAVFLEGASPSACTRLSRDEVAEIEEQRGLASGRRSAREAEPSDRAVAALLEEVASRDFKTLSARSGALWVNDVQETLCVAFLGRTHRVSAQGVATEEGPSGARAAFTVLHYLSRSEPVPPQGRWRPHGMLEGTGQTVKAVRASMRELAETFRGRPGDLDRAAATLGARAATCGSATRAYLLPALPRVPVLLRFWDAAEDPEGRQLVQHPDYGRFRSSADFDARAEVHLDAGVGNHLEPQGLQCLVAELVARLSAAATDG